MMWSSWKAEQSLVLTSQVQNRHFSLQLENYKNAKPVRTTAIRHYNTDIPKVIKTEWKHGVIAELGLTKQDRLKYA